MSVDTPSVYIYTHTHTHCRSWWMIPSGRSWQERPLPPAILLSLALHTHSFISLPPASLALAFCFLYLHWRTPQLLWIPFASQSLILVHLSNIPSLSIFCRGSLIPALQFSSPPRRFYQTKSIFKVKSELELWTLGLSAWGKFPSGEQLYTLADAHTHRGTYHHICKYFWMCFQRTSLFFLFAALNICPCAPRILQLWTLFVPDPNHRMKATEGLSAFSGLFSRVK